MLYLCLTPVISCLIFGFASADKVSASQLREISETILKLDVNHVTLNYNLQNKLKTTANGRIEDVATKPLFLSTEINKIPTYNALENVQDNYILNTKSQEVASASKNEEVKKFLDVISGTDVFKRTFIFLASHGLVSNDTTKYKEFLRELWFTPYVRQHALSSSGFEHVFVGEMKFGNEPIGFHNWVRFKNLEKLGRINYLGYYEASVISNAISLVTFAFEVDGKVKEKTGFFIGSSPEFELSLYTLCFLTRPNKLCHVSLNGKHVKIATSAIEYKGRSYLGTSFPLI